MKQKEFKNRWTNTKKDFSQGFVFVICSLTEQIHIEYEFPRRKPEHSPRMSMKRLKNRIGSREKKRARSFMPTLKGFLSSSFKWVCTESRRSFFISLHNLSSKCYSEKNWYLKISKWYSNCMILLDVHVLNVKSSHSVQWRKNLSNCQTKYSLVKYYFTGKVKLFCYPF